METVKNIAAIIGLILSAAAVITLLSKTLRRLLSSLFKKYGNSDAVFASIAEIKSMLERHIEDEGEFKEYVAKMNEINVEFTKTQCRNTIKTIFYKYKDTKVLPLYEKKMLMNVEELYVGRLDGNSFAKFLLDVMKDWEVDYEADCPDEDPSDV